MWVLSGSACPINCVHPRLQSHQGKKTLPEGTRSPGKEKRCRVAHILSKQNKPVSGWQGASLTAAHQIIPLPNPQRFTWILATEGKITEPLKWKLLEPWADSGATEGSPWMQTSSSASWCWSAGHRRLSRGSQKTGGRATTLGIPEMGNRVAETAGALGYQEVSRRVHEPFKGCWRLIVHMR